MSKKYLLSVGLSLMILLIGCSVHKVEPVEGNTETAEGSKGYKLIYENPVDGSFIEKKIEIEDENVEKKVIYELFRLENIPQSLHKAFNSGKLEVLDVEFDKDGKMVKIDFNKELYSFERQTDDVRYFRSALYHTLAQFPDVEYIEIYAEGKYIEGLGEQVLSGKIHREE